MAQFEWTFVIFALSVAFIYSDQKLCNVCKCSNSGDVDCSRRNLKMLPKIQDPSNKTIIVKADWNQIGRIQKFPRVVMNYLSLSHNSIGYIEDSSFSNVLNLSSLDLSYNLLTSDKMLPGIFRGHYAADSSEPLRSLKHLYLDHNRLHVLHPDLFEHTPHLETLSLSGNPLTVLDMGTIKAISTLPDLKTLNLSSTQLHKIPEHFLYAPKHLEMLDLSKNVLTVPPIELDNTHSIKWLSLSGNPIQVIRVMPKLPLLTTLHLSNMRNLTTIEAESLNSLPQLEAFYCSNNELLDDINGAAFSRRDSGEEGETWPPIRKIDLSNNRLHYLDNHLIGRWDKLEEINLGNNAWVCDCENQWLISVLIPLTEALNQSNRHEKLDAMRCKEPVEMEEKPMVELYRKHYHMRCLDVYSHRPERDGTLLICIFITVLTISPLLVVLLLYCQRLNRTPDYYRKTLFSKLIEEMEN